MISIYLHHTKSPLKVSHSVNFEQKTGIFIVYVWDKMIFLNINETCYVLLSLKWRTCIVYIVCGDDAFLPSKQDKYK